MKTVISVRSSMAQFVTLLAILPVAIAQTVTLRTGVETTYDDRMPCLDRQECKDQWSLFSAATRGLIYRTVIKTATGYRATTTSPSPSCRIPMPPFLSTFNLHSATTSGISVA